MNFFEIIVLFIENYLPFMPTLSEIFKSKIGKDGLSKTYVADKLGVTEKTTENYMNGKREPKPKALITLSKLLNFSLSDLTDSFEHNVPRGNQGDKKNPSGLGQTDEKSNAVNEKDSLYKVSDKDKIRAHDALFAVLVAEVASLRSERSGEPVQSVIRCFEFAGKKNPRFTNNRFNKYKSYLSMIFKELIEAEAIDTNPTRDISVKKRTRVMKAILTPEEEIEIDQHLKQVDYRFWRHMRMYFDCQARTTEMMQLRKNDRVRIDQQEIIVTVKKGSMVKEDSRIISKEMIHLWKEVWSEAKPGQYLFSKFLKPGDKPIRPDQIGRRWDKYVMAPRSEGGLGIKKKYSSLRNLGADKMSAEYGLKIASISAGHTNTGTTRRFYTPGEVRREKELLKQKVVKFGG